MNKQKLFYVLNFYVFFEIQNIGEVMQKMLLICLKKRLKGTVIIAGEGINAGLSSDSYSNLLFVLNYVKQVCNKEVISFWSESSFNPFQKVKVKVKKEIISMGNKNIDVSNGSGKYIDSKNWDSFTDDPDVIMIDTRNKYEVELGSFIGSINPLTNRFKDFPDWVSRNHDSLKGKKIAMFCTGGVRCEKSTAYLRSLGYNNLFHLKGGILSYLKTQNNVNNKWRGDCFVFDNRVKIIV